MRFELDLTLWHRSSTDISSHAAAFEVHGIVACHDLNLVTSEVVKVGDDSRLLREHLQLHLCKKVQDAMNGMGVSDFILRCLRVFVF